mgnify:CR=1 FL=1
MKAKVVVAKATEETAAALYEVVRRIMNTTAIKAYPSLDYEAVFFPVDYYDCKFIAGILKDKGYTVRIENAE